MKSNFKLIEDIYMVLKHIDKNVTGLKQAKKITNTKTTNQDSLVINVKNKIPYESIEEGKLLPVLIKVENDIFITDVVEESYVYIDSCNQGEPQDLNTPDKNSRLYWNRVFVNPLSGGCNLTKWTPRSIKTFCTLGGIFKDKQDGSYVGLTNRHCVDRLYYVQTFNVDKQDPTYYFEETYPLTIPFLNYYSSISPMYSIEILDLGVYDDYTTTTVNFVSVIRNYSLKDTNYYNPSLYDDPVGVPLTDAPSGNNYIGSFKRAVPCFLYYQLDESTHSIFNYVDAALIGLSNRVDSSSRFYIGFNYTGEIKVANDEEINSLYENEYPLFFSGSRSGPSGFPGTYYHCVSSKVVSIDTIIEVSDPYFATEGVKQVFSDCLIFNTYDRFGDISIAARGGDSGSIVWGLFPGGWKIVGLLFAGSTDGINGVFCRITRVLKELNIEVWNGEPLNFSKPLHEIILKSPPPFLDPPNLEEGNLVRKIKLDGKEYHYTGLRETDMYNDITYTL